MKQQEQQGTDTLPALHFMEMPFLYSPFLIPRTHNFQCDFRRGNG